MKFYSGIHRTYLLLIVTLCVSLAAKATYPDRLISKAEKMAVKKFRDTEIIKEPVFPGSSRYLKENTDTIFRLIQKEGQMVGYLVISSAMGRFEEFDFMIVYNADLTLIDLNILVYRSEYGYQVSSRGWLKQFLHHPAGTNYIYGQNIDAISGATFSGKSLTSDITRLNMLVGTLNK